MPAQGEIARRVLRWRREFGRQGLPWMGTRDPYRVWLSEIMLQQTRVSTVLDYYARFVRRFPDVAALAEAPLDDVLALWSGLGYYSRARNLHRCAQVVMHEFGGTFPPSSRVLAELPGIGRSTAAAIAAFCFGERVAILDGNVKRVLSRVFAFDRDLSRGANERALWQLAQEQLPLRDVAGYTQGLMDLGATLCQARAPECPRCPLAELCAAHRQGCAESYPVKLRRLQRGRRTHALLWLLQADRQWLVQRPARGVWAGLWSLPEFDSVAALHSLTGSWPGQGDTLPTIEHAVTHFDWTLQPLRWRLPAHLSPPRLQAITTGLPAGRWFSTAQAAQLGLPAPVRKLLAC